MSDQLTLTDQQRGSLRHIRNLANQLPDDWSRMQGPSTMQEDFGSLRFQLAYMFYALALTHVHRLPAAPGVFRKSMQSLIEKIMAPDVWTYWHYVSTGGFPLNFSLGELEPQWNPVEKDNIMYSAYVQSMALMYHHLFSDDRYAQPGGLTFEFKPMFWGRGEQSFPYDERSLNDIVYWQMVQNGYLGVACEPNCIFQICNQPAIFGFRFHDIVYGGDTAEEVTQGYLAAWSDFGLTTESGHFNMMIQEKEKVVFTPENAPWVDFWLGTMMHAWNPEFVEQHYPQHAAKWMKRGPGDTLWVPPVIPDEPAFKKNTTAREHGWAAACAAELGDTESLRGLLAYADEFLGGTWEKGGYYYPRRDRWLDDEGYLAAMEPHTGNALLSLARLNIPSGFEKLYRAPWDATHFQYPSLTDLDFELDVLRADYDQSARKLTLGVAPMVGETSARSKLEISNVPADRDWALVIDGEEVLKASGGSMQGAWSADAQLADGKLTFAVEIKQPTEVALQLA